jgi:hypothetical protein
MRKSLKWLLRGLLLIGVVVGGIVNFKMNESSNTSNTSNFTLKKLETRAYGNESESGDSGASNTSNCWKKEGSSISGKHFTKCKSGTTSSNILMCDGTVNDHYPDYSTSGKCHTSPVN